MSTTTKPEPKPKIETKQLRHDFTDLEKAGMGGDLSRVIAGLRQTQNEADESKASFKAKITAAEAEVDRISTSLMNGWEFRMKRVRVVLRPKDNREEICLFPPAGVSQGILVVGRFKGRWHTALRINIDNKHKVEERLDSEQKSVKARWDAIKLAAGRAQQWFADTLGEENAAGFKDPIANAIEAHREREE